MLYDEGNPRAIAYQMSRIEEHVNSLPEVQGSETRNHLQRLALEAATMVRLADVQRLARIDADPGGEKPLTSSWRHWQNACPQFPIP